MNRRLRFAQGLLLFAAPSLALAQNPPSATPARCLKVDAPYAQNLILQVKTAHPELKKIGLHAIPPGETDSVIVANAIPAKIGKVSSPRDLTVVTSGVPTVTPHAEEGGFFDLGLPLTSVSGDPIGMMVMEIPYKYAGTQDRALTLGTRIRDEIAEKIPGKQSLFQPISGSALTPASRDGKR